MGQLRESDPEFYWLPKLYIIRAAHYNSDIYLDW